MRKNFLYTLLGVVIAGGLWLSPAPLLGEANCFWMEMDGRTISNCFGHAKIDFTEPKVLVGKVAADPVAKVGNVEAAIGGPDFFMGNGALMALFKVDFGEIFGAEPAPDEGEEVAQQQNDNEYEQDGDGDFYQNGNNEPSQQPTGAEQESDTAENEIVEKAVDMGVNTDNAETNPGPGNGDGEGGGIGWYNPDQQAAESARDSAEAASTAMAAFAAADRNIQWNIDQATSNFNKLPKELTNIMGEVLDETMNDNPVGDKNLPDFQTAQRNNLVPGGTSGLVVATTDVTREKEKDKIPDKVKGDPVNPYTGGFTYDFSLGQAYDGVSGKIPLGGSFRSDRVSSPPGPMGFGTSHTFYEYVTEQGSGENQVLILQQQDGTSLHFTQIDDHGIGTAGPTKPITQDQLREQFDFCAEMEITEKRTRANSLSPSVTFKSPDSLITVDKRWMTFAVRIPGQPCRGASILYYTVRYPTGATKIFRGVLDTPEMYQDISFCSTEHTHEGALNLANLGEPTGVVNYWQNRSNVLRWGIEHQMSCKLIIEEGGFDSIAGWVDRYGEEEQYDPFKFGKCKGDLKDLYPINGSRNAREYNDAISYNWPDHESMLHELLNAELVVNDFGECIPAHSPIGAALRESNLLVPFHQTMIIDRHPKLPILHGRTWERSEQFPKERHDGWHPFGQQWSPSVDNVGNLHMIKNYRWLAHALGVRPPHALEGCNGDNSWNCDDRSAEGTWISVRYTGSHLEAPTIFNGLGLDEEWKSGIAATAHKLHYYRPMDVFDITRVSSGIVAPLTMVKDPRAGTLHIDYNVEWEDFRQYLTTASDFMGWNCSNPMSVECDNEFDPTCRAQKITCNVPQPGVGVPPGMRRKFFRSQTRVEDIQRTDDQIAKTLTMTVRRGETRIATFNYKYALMRDFQLERSMPFDLPADAQTLRNPNHYKPVRTVYYSAPVLQNIEHPGLDDNVTLTYAAPTQNGMCGLDEFAYGDYQERFVTYDDGNSPIQRIEGTPSPGTTARNRGWTIANQPKTAQEDCGSVATGFSPLHLYNQLYNPERDGATSPTYGPQFFSKPGDFENNPMHYYNGPLVLNRVRFNVEQEQVEGEEPLGVRFDFRLEDDPENLLSADGVSRKNIRLIDVFRGEDRPELHLRYDEITGRVYQQQIGGENSISFDYTLNDDGRNTETHIVTRAGEEVTIHYDEEGRITQQTAGDGTSIRYVYNPRSPGPGLDGAGQLKDIVYPNGVVKRHHYSGNWGPDNMLVSRIEIIPNDGGAARTTDFSYNDRGHDFGLIGLLEHIATPTTEGPGARARTQYAYDFEVPELNPCNTEKPQGNLVRVTYPDGSFEAWTHNKQGNAMEHRNQQGVVTKYTYKPFADDKMNCSIIGILEGYTP